MYRLVDIDNKCVFLPYMTLQYRNAKYFMVIIFEIIKVI